VYFSLSILHSFYIFGFLSSSFISKLYCCQFYLIWYTKYTFVDSIYSLYSEINEYDENYWSKFIILICITCIVIISTFLYTTLFSELDLIIRLICFCVSFIFISVLVSVITITSSISSNANDTYKLVCSLFGQRLTNQLSNGDRLKVRLKMINFVH